jgi:hypothetical protein
MSLVQRIALGTFAVGIASGIAAGAYSLGRQHGAAAVTEPEPAPPIANNAASKQLARDLVQQELNELATRSKLDPMQLRSSFDTISRKTGSWITPRERLQLAAHGMAQGKTGTHVLRDLRMLEGGRSQWDVSSPGDGTSGNGDVAVALLQTYRAGASVDRVVREANYQKLIDNWNAGVVLALGPHGLGPFDRGDSTSYPYAAWSRYEDMRKHSMASPVIAAHLTNLAERTGENDRALANEYLTALDVTHNAKRALQRVRAAHSD